MRRLLHTLFLHSGREERASRLLRRGASIGMLAMVIISFTAANLQALLWQSSDWLVSSVLPGLVVEMTNDERATLAQSPLMRSDVLDEAARLKAEDMASNEYFSHNSPAGVTPWHWFEEVGYTYAHAGENLAIHFSDSNEVVDAWMKSPTHRANIVNTEYSEIGVGTAKGNYEGYETVYVVQLFGTPAAAPTLIKEAKVVVLGINSIAPTTTPPLNENVLNAVEIESSDDLVDAGAVLSAASQGSIENNISTPSATATGSEEFVASTSSDELLAKIENISTPTDVPTIPPTMLHPNKLIISAPEYVEPEPVFDVTTQATNKEMVSIYSGFMATSSGLPMSVRALGEASGTTKIALAGRLATSPSSVLQISYLFLGTIVTLMLILSLFLGLRSERPWQIVYSVAMLVAMGGLITIHVYLTSGAVVV